MSSINYKDFDPNRLQFVKVQIIGGVEIRGQYQYEREPEGLNHVDDNADFLCIPTQEYVTRPLVIKEPSTKTHNFGI